jgi:pimeloyl-ACP methyl ester carboxylesterase
LPAAQVEAIRGSSFWQIVADCAPVFLPEIEAGRRFRFEPSMFSDLAVPTLLVTGTLSQPALRPVTEAVAAALPDARIHELPGQGHGAMNAAPAEFASIVADFVAP